MPKSNKKASLAGSTADIESSAMAKNMACHRARLLYVRRILKIGKQLPAKTVKTIFDVLGPEIEEMLKAHRLGGEEHKYRLLQQISAIMEKRLTDSGENEMLIETTELIDSALKVHEAAMSSVLGKKYGEFEREMKKVEAGFKIL